MDEEQLVEGLRARRDDAVRAYLERYRALFFHCVSQFESDPARHEELFNDLAWHALERLELDRFDALRGSFGTWLYRVAWCRCVDLRRRAGSRRRVKLATGVTELPDRVDPHPEPVDELGESEIGVSVRAALDTLEAEDRSLLELRHGEDLTLQEVADELSLSLEQTKYRLKRATVNLRRALLARMPRSELEP